MKRILFKSKIHRATVTDANLNYQGSITVDPVLLDAANIVAYEQVHVVNLSNGARFETYAVRGEEGSGEVVLNGGSARLVQPGDLVIILSYAAYEAEEVGKFVPTVVFVDSNNHILPSAARLSA